MYYGLKPLQNKILDIIKDIDALCKANDIDYYLMGGSALGAIRHEGFIPWDDDLDIFMTFDNYFKFIEICKIKLNKDIYYLQQENTKEWPLFYTKIRMNGTTYIESFNENINIHQGIFIDVFCLNNISNNNIEAHFQYFFARLLTASALGKKYYETNSLLKKTTIFLSNIFLKDKLRSYLLKYIRKYNYSNCLKVGHLFGKARFKNAIFPKKYLGKPRYVKFENTYLPTLEYVEKYLYVRFGDYKKMPSKEEIEVVQHAVMIDLEKDYKEYLVKK